jgi:1,4-alpha-glucan branching enzyme
MGEEWATERPFLFFCDFAPPLDEAVRQGRRREFAQFPEFSDPEAQQRIPDPTVETTFVASRLDWRERVQEPHARWLDRYRELLRLRRERIAPLLAGIRPGGDYQVIGDAALRVRWNSHDGAALVLLANLGDRAVPLATPAPAEKPLYCTAQHAIDRELPASCAAFYLVPAATAVR